jgi:hypothetical protein
MRHEYRDGRSRRPFERLNDSCDTVFGNRGGIQLTVVVSLDGTVGVGTLMV